ncbi:hypothetical protein [Methylobacterium sp. WL120]|uniref:hypothetical protein n=1 Tax=Methylobacterium sp. WL120 TaxID=2603887 RepID=UPI001650623C|nr:hypothetical protein [Methylobacterium sp. WL120]
MIVVQWWIDTGFPTASHSGEWEVEDDTTDAELEEMLRDEIANHIESGFRRETDQ